MSNYDLRKEFVTELRYCAKVARDGTIQVGNSDEARMEYLGVQLAVAARLARDGDMAATVTSIDKAIGYVLKGHYGTAHSVLTDAADELERRLEKEITTPKSEALDLSKYEGHTPGPWAVCTDFINVYAPESNTAITSTEHCCAPSQAEQDANARLIADAPKLLEELQRTTAKLRTLEVVASGEVGRTHDQILKLRQALSRIVDTNSIEVARQIACEALL